MTNASMFLAPGDVAFPPFFNSHKFKNLEFDYGIRTSVSAPIIEGIAATIITEHFIGCKFNFWLEIKFTTNK